jgi:GntR family transcriptional regulator / MocR family aminotransferase
VDRLPLTLPQDRKPLFRRLASALREAFRAGRLRGGDRLPSTRVLAEQLDVHRHTVMAAYEELLAEGWLESQPGWGYRVSPEQAPPVAESPRASQPGFTWTFDHPLPFAEEPPGVAAKYRFPSGQADLRIFPHDEYYAQVRLALRRCAPEDLLGYSDPGGRPSFCEQLGHYLRRARGLEFCSDQLTVTNGCQEAVYLAARAWVRAGDVVAVENQGFRRIWNAFQACGAELAPVEIDAEGLVPESLERVLRAGRVRMIYVTPLHQYPTTVTLSPARRQQLYGLALQYGTPILEDDYDFEFHYHGEALPPLKSNDPHGLVLYCSTFSKVLHPSARLGFLLASPAFSARVRALKGVVSRQNDNLAQESLALWMADGGFERHLRRMRRHYQIRRETMQTALRRWGIEVTPPRGGMCYWFDTGVNTAELSRRALSHGVDVRPGQHYRLDGAPSSFLRLGFAYPTPEEIEQGMELLRRERDRLRG